MCGICGIIKNSITENTLNKMQNALIHRGPDAAGFYLSDDHSVGFAHRRLKIIDLSDNANQPISNEDGTIWIVYNGKFYDFREYFTLLEKKGHVFKSKSDAEVVLHLFEEFGFEFIHKLNGMFTFAIWDERKNRLVLAMDPVGIKPLYYYYNNSVFAFASEIKSLLQIPEISKEIDFDALNLYFALGYIPQEYSIYKDIRKLPPGSLLVYEDGNVRKQKYYSISSVNIMNDENGLVDHLHNLLKESVRKSMISDVSIGVFLSGGVDSSILATIAASLSDKPIKTFSIGFEETKYNELFYAKRIADNISSDHHEFLVTIDAVDALDKIALQYDEPFADSSAIPTYYVAKKAKEYVKVALSGDGGDELFGGYNWYTWVIKAQSMKNRFGFLSKLISTKAKRIPFDFKGKNFLSILNYDALTQFIKRTFIFNSSERERLINKQISNKMELLLPERKIVETFNSIDSNLITKMQNVDFNFYLPYDGLVKVDRASMLSSLEVRPPYLDKEIIKFAFSLPEEYKIRGGVKKYLLKKVAKKILPPRFPLERKQGFCIPLQEWMNGRIGNILVDSLADKRLCDFIDLNYVRSLLKTHRSGKKDNGAKLWSILMFSLWVRNYL